jgi:hypothetical protein
VSGNYSCYRDKEYLDMCTDRSCVLASEEFMAMNAILAPEGNEGTGRLGRFMDGQRA